MSGLLEPVRDWFAGLTGRERWLVGIAGVLAAIVIGIYGIVLPLGALHDDAHVHHREAVEASGRVMARLEALADAPDAPVAGSGPVAQMVAAAADAQGLVLQANEARGNDATQISVPTSAPGAALALLDALGKQGINAEQVTITPSADGSVSLNATLTRATP
ncbi:type II secretion system protein GspM [Croceicoccus mobilis]|uniref:Type II secretion system protein M n=1 Tax=Croceicoccus mobilis TaxID=1703339 RepID=A0A916Z028_9SPHN|nr:type II secretion system protein GspM [Croceicoccus mobilis]GGD69250.1 hypothetical protein GCM10010990_18480 [Croceicoccus mobilis]